MSKEVVIFWDWGLQLMECLYAWGGDGDVVSLFRL